MKGLTKKQRRVFEFIRSQIIEANRPPTIREIGKKFNLSSVKTVRDVFRGLTKKGSTAPDAGSADYRETKRRAVQDGQQTPER